MKKILVVTTFNNHFRFFFRLSQTLRKLDFETHYLTNKLSILREAENLDAIVDIIKNLKSPEEKFLLDRSFEEAAGFLDGDKASEIAASVWSKLEQKFSEVDYDLIFLWGGVRIIELTAAEFAKQRGLRTLFFEIGNFPGKVFVDPYGTNAQSLLAEKPGILQSLSYDLNNYRDWSEKYISEGLVQHAVPQSKSAANVEYLKNVHDIIGFQFKNLIQTEPILTKEKITGKYLRKILNLNYDDVNLSNTKYLFYPMQVNKDAQLVLNSNVGNLEALQIANDRANELGIELLVKPHPGEVEFGFIKKVNELKEKIGFGFVNNNTIELIIYAEEVITINSTVGLQAKIARKVTRCLGKAFYNSFDDKMIAAYIQSYLIDAEFWNEKEITLDSAKEILSRAELS